MNGSDSGDLDPIEYDPGDQETEEKNRVECGLGIPSHLKYSKRSTHCGCFEKISTSSQLMNIK